jgi:glycolate oxidase FAD binding subunit
LLHVIENPPDPALLARHQPANVSEVGELVRQAAASGQAIYPAGGQTEWDLGLPPTRPGLLLDMRRLDQVIEYPARDMTITVQSGMTVARLQALLAGEKQRLPIDVPHADRATLGGILATNASGPRRFGWGTLRDYVIGISVVNDRGHEIKAGGRVVKNVAGYDLCKLYVGSLGTLGVITQVTFKLRPLAAEQALFAILCPPDELDPALAQLHATRTRPVCMTMLSPAATEVLGTTLNEIWPCEWSLIVGFEDNADALKWQVGQLVNELGGRYSLNGLLGACADPVWRELSEFGGTSDASWSFKAGVPAAATAAFCVEAARVLAPVRLQAHAGNGIVVGQCLGADVVDQLHKVRGLAAAAGGHLVFTRCPARWKDAAFVWGPRRGDAELMRAIKDKLDPCRLFNPGRFVDGI